MILNYQQWRSLHENQTPALPDHWVVYEGKLWDGNTGEEVLLEDWSLSDILHTAADVASMAADYVLPGSGAIIDILNATSYIVEAQFKPEEERDTLYLMAAITAAFVILPGPLQGVAIPLKNFVKGGAKVASGAIRSALKVVGGILDKVLLGLPSKIKSALKTKLGSSIAGKYKGKINAALTAFTSRVKKIFNKLTGAKSAASARATKTATKSLGVRAALTLSKLTPAFVKKLNSLATKSALKFGGKSPLKIAASVGVQPGKIYRYINAQGKASSVFIKSIKNDGTVVALSGPLKSLKLGKGVAGGVQFTSKLENFLPKTVAGPWLRHGSSVTVPLFVKQFVRMFNDNGEISQDVNVEQLQPLSADEVSQWMIQNWPEDQVDYEGETLAYSSSEIVKAAQDALTALGKPPIGGSDGLFGPNTKASLNAYETEKGLTLSTTAINKETAQAMVNDLVATNTPQNQEIAKRLAQIPPPEATQAI